MRVTGFAILMIGLAAAVFTGIGVATTKPASATSVGTAAVSPEPTVPPVVIPLIVALGGIGVGGGMLLFGRRGYDTIPDPAVRN